MKQISTTLLLCLSALILFAQKNYPILSLEEIGAACIVPDEEIMVVVENIGETPNLAFYNLEKKALMQAFSAQLPENPIQQMVPCDNGLLYMVTIKKNPEQGPPLFDAIYSFDYKKDIIKRVYTEKEAVYVPKLAAVHTKLLLSGNPFRKPPLVFNLETNEFEPFSNDNSLRMLCAADTHNSYVVFKENELGDDDTVPVYVMDKSGKLSESVGVYDSRMVASTNKDENRMPGFTITNANYNWVADAFDMSGFPLSGFAIAMHPGLAAKYNKTANLYDIREIVSANEKYMAATGKGNFWVYNTQTPNAVKPQTVSNKDLAAIQKYFDEKITFTKLPVQSAAVSEVFAASFYAITERTKFEEGGYGESSFIAFGQGDKYDVLKTKAQLVTLVNSNFKLNSEQKASVFQDALNALYPPGTFEKKHIQCFKKDNTWCFVRDESFGEKKGFVVQLNANNGLEKIEYSDKIN